MKHPKDNIILFDGVCKLCNASVQFVIKKDPQGKFHFASLQSETGQDLLKKHGLKIQNFDTFILLQNGQIFQKSTAALKVSRQLKGLWPVLYIFIFIPPFIRDAFYNLIAKNRYKLFGKKETCMIPTPAIQERFLEGD